MHVICIGHWTEQSSPAIFIRITIFSLKTTAALRAASHHFFPALSSLFLSDKSTVVKYKKARKTQTWRKGLCLQEQGQGLFSPGVTRRAMSEGITRLRTHLGLSKGHGVHPLTGAGY